MEKAYVNKLSNFNYLIGLIAIFAGVYSQYFFHGYGIIPQLAIVYGIPVLIAGIVLGRPILKRAFKNNKIGFSYSIAFFGIAVVLTYIIIVATLYFISQINPEWLLPLDQPLPFLEISSNYAWLMIVISMLVIGPAEEFLFRGFVFGGMLRLFRHRHWLYSAFLSSVIFALAHLYYFFIFGLISFIFFFDIVAIGMALAIAYYYSKGNLVAPAFIHGFFDATDFLGIATATHVGILLRILMAILGLIVAFYLIIKYLIGKVAALKFEQ